MDVFRSQKQTKKTFVDFVCLERREIRRRKINCQPGQFKQISPQSCSSAVPFFLLPTRDVFADPQPPVRQVRRLEGVLNREQRVPSQSRNPLHLDEQRRTDTLLHFRGTMAAETFLKNLKSHSLSVVRRAGDRRATPLLASFTTASEEISSQKSPPSAAPAAALRQETESGSWSKLLLFLPGALTFGLGTWQIMRRQEKIEMIDYRKMRLDMDPVIWRNFNLSSEDAPSLEFRKICCEGVFDESRNVYIGPRSRSISGVTENGYYVITPLMPATDDSDSVQAPILVNRGWVPRQWKQNSMKTTKDKKDHLLPTAFDAEKTNKSTWWKFWSAKPEPCKMPASTTPSIKVVGVTRSSENPSIFVPENDPSSGQWFYVDVSAIARACGLPENTVYIEDIDENVNPRNPYPLPKDVNTLIRYSVMPQDHLNYTLTWYTLSAAVTYMASKRIKAGKYGR